MADKKAYFKAYYEANRERIKAQAAEYRKNNPERARAAVERWHADPANAERRRDNYARYYAQNKHEYIERSSKRRSAQMKRTPAWLSKDDLWLIRECYALSDLRTKVTGIRWHVDHIVPLQGREVCGLHVPQNLRVIEAKANLCKRNKLILEEK